METTLVWIALGLAGLAVVIALLALGKAAAAGGAAGDAEREVRRRAENAGEEARRELDVLRQMLAVVASGGRLTRDQVLEGRLWNDMSPSEGKRLFEAGGLRLVDVRTPGETSGGIIPGALLIPVDELEARMRELPKAGAPKLIYCASGGRSAAACEFLTQQGFTNLSNLEGGFGAWPGPRARP